MNRFSRVMGPAYGGNDLKSKGYLIDERHILVHDASGKQEKSLHGRPKGEPTVARRIAEESNRVREQADRAHQDVLETLYKMNAIEDPGYHPLVRKCSSKTEGLLARPESPGPAPLAEAHLSLLDLDGSTIAGSSTHTLSSCSTLVSSTTVEDQERRIKALSDERLVALRASLPPLNLGTPPILPPPPPPPSAPLPRQFSSRRSELPIPAQANLYFTLELPSECGFVHSPLPPLHLRLPLTNEDSLTRASTIATLQTYFFHGVPIQFFQRFFPKDVFGPALVEPLAKCRQGRHRGSLVWNLPQLFGPRSPYRALVEEVWEAGSLGLLGSWVDAGDAGFAEQVVGLLGRIAAAMAREQGRWTGLAYDGEGKGVMLDVAVVVRQYFPRGGGGYGRLMDVRRMRRGVETLPPGFVPS